ncbi:hypothetical protein KKC_07557 [Listeria fleischmannii subsp. coloradonensis]|nr:hypothetical protein KKC_07557 [Listeria fleischmannii subsp. coloradonensis]EUJ62860.1 hypothetical protein MCOL2_03511 [Listeria fleischmannii FSL S10-1203]STY46431.1 Uncharacterised protein [Listeria fleischmannii subsp. coloradonensis]
MNTVVDFLDRRTEDFVNYWISTYYVYSEEYALRRHVEGFLDAQHRETTFLFRKALQYFGKNEGVPHLEEIGQDRHDMQTPFDDAYTNLSTFFTALMEFLMIHHENRTLNCSQTKLFKALLEIRKMEAASGLSLITGYYSQIEESNI